MNDRRGFLRNSGAMAALLGMAGLAPQGGRIALAAGSFSVVDARGIRVRRGAPQPNVRVPGVRIESIQLRMPDGIWIAGSLYLPDPMPSQSIPALFKLTAYRKDDNNLGQVIFQNGFFARNGYAILRADVRGTGASEGIATGEYSDKENHDGHLIIEWLARQPWCNRRVGIYGKSWEGVNSLTIAATQPPSLKAAAPCYASDDLYNDDVHYLGGVPQILENVYASYVSAIGVMPGAPDYDPHTPSAIARFNEEPWGFQWIEQQTDGPYWQRASVAADYSRLKVPMLCIGGWLDGYVNFPGRLAKYAPAPVKVLMGPYLHEYPWEASTGPRIDALHSHLLRWFDRWLKGDDNGITEEPPVTLYMPRWRREGFRFRGPWPGEWLHLRSFPANYLDPTDRFFLKPDVERAVATVESSTEPVGERGSLAQLAGAASAVKARYVPDGGVNVKSFAPTDFDGQYGLDQREDDSKGLCFDSEPLREAVKILGAPRARLFVSATAPIATWIIRICDVAPDGTSYWVTRGVLNGTHRSSHERPEPLEPGVVYELEVSLYATAWTFEPGHRIRIVVSNGYWPHIWPSPYAMTTMLYTGSGRASHVDLPIFRGRSEPAPQDREPVEVGFETGVKAIERPGKALAYNYTRDFARNEHVLEFNTDGREWAQLPQGVRCHMDSTLATRVNATDPALASVTTEGAFHIETGTRRLDSEVTFRIDSTRDTFNTIATARLSENGKELRARRWEKRVARKLV